ncbi:MAG: zinc-dependent metalloprotease [Candidatus Geothermincolales bacterium]
MERDESYTAWEKGLEWASRFIDGIARQIPFFKTIREAFTAEGEDLINWAQAEEIAVLVAQAEAVQGPPPGPEVIGAFQEMRERSLELVGRYSRLIPREPIGDILVLDRPGWIRANLNSFRLIFSPLAESYRRTLEKFEGGGGAFAALGKRITHGILTAQLGMVIGYLARNVLGQFDLGLPDMEDGGKLYIVYPNMLKAERNLRLVPSDFRLWITLHEITHAFEFASHPWLRRYLRELMERYFSSVSLRLEEISLRLRPEELTDARQLDEIMREGGLISVIHTPEQRAILADIQAFMSLVEGYSNLIMDLAGRDMIPSYEEMSRAFRRRRELKSGAERFIERMLGFDLKLQQYHVGELFCREVYETKGLDFLNLAWRYREYLPRPEEIKKPYLWMERVSREEGDHIVHHHI